MKAQNFITVQRLLLLLCLALSAPFLVFIVIWCSQQSMLDRETAGTQMLSAARTTAARLDDHIGDIQQLLSTLSVIVVPTAERARDNDVVLRNVLPRLPAGVDKLSVWAADGSLVGSTDTGPPDPPDTVASSKFFLDAMRKDGLVAEAPVAWPPSGEMVAVFALQIHGQSGAAGVVSVRAPLRQLQTLLPSGASLLPDSVTTVYDGSGVVLARSSDADHWIGRSLQTFGGGIPQDVGRPEGVRDGPSADGIVRIAGYTHANRLPWQVYVGVPEAIALASTRRRLFEGLLLGLVLLAGGVLVSMSIAKRISRPLLQLEADAQRLALGELSHRSRLAQTRELASLASAFNQMADALHQRTLLLQTSEEQLSDLYANAPFGYYSLDPEGQILRINETALNWFGQRRDDAIGRPISTFLTEEGRVVFKREFPRLIELGRVEGFQLDVVDANGRRRRVAVTATSVKDRDGVFIATRTALYDVTELEEARENLREVSAEQQAMLNTELIGILKSKARTITWANPGAERILGYERDELLGRSARSLYPDEATYRRVAEEGHALLEAGEMYRSQLQVTRRDGMPVWLDLQSIALPSNREETMTLLTDITSLKRAEQVRVQLLALEANNRELAESNRLANLFLSNMSHELRTPLNAVLGYAHLLQIGGQSMSSPKSEGYVRQIESSGKELLGLIDAMLDVAKLESGRLSFVPSRVDLSSVIRATADLHRSAMAAKDISITIEVEDGARFAFLDASRLTQVISVFLSNAVKFSARGGAIRVVARGATAGTFRLEVHDSGIGIAETSLPRLFKPFQQLSEGSRKQYPGAGLGLAVARRLVEAQGGSIGVESRLGKGSVFHLVLPTSQSAID